MATSAGANMSDNNVIKIIEDKEGRQIKLLRQIGEGGYGQVYLADHPSHVEKVAVKELKPEHANFFAQKRFKEERRALAECSLHPNIVHIYDFFEYNNSAYLVTEYCSNGSLDKCAGPIGKNQNKKYEKLRNAAVLEYAKQVLDGLEFMHAKKIIHGDIKPSNLLLGVDKKGNEILKIADFGQAFVPLEFYGQGVKPRGDRFFAAPENIDWRSPSTPASDLYSLGASLYLFLVGKPYLPFSGDAEADLTRICARKDEDMSVIPPHQLVEHLPIGLSKIVMKSLSVNPAHRYRSASHMKKDLITLTLHPAKANPLILSGAAVVLALLIIGGVWLSQGSAIPLANNGKRSESLISPVNNNKELIVPDSTLPTANGDKELIVNGNFTNGFEGWDTTKGIPPNKNNLSVKNQQPCENATTKPVNLATVAHTGIGSDFIYQQIDLPTNVDLTKLYFSACIGGRADRNNMGAYVPIPGVNKGNLAGHANLTVVFYDKNTELGRVIYRTYVIASIADGKEVYQVQINNTPTFYSLNLYDLISQRLKAINPTKVSMIRIFLLATSAANASIGGENDNCDDKDWCKAEIYAGNISLLYKDK